MKGEEEYNSLFEKEGSIEAPPSTKGVGRIWGSWFCSIKKGSPPW